MIPAKPGKPADALAVFTKRHQLDLIEGVCILTPSWRTAGFARAIPKASRRGRSFAPWAVWVPNDRRRSRPGHRFRHSSIRRHRLCGRQKIPLPAELLTASVDLHGQDLEAGYLYWDQRDHLPSAADRRATACWASPKIRAEE